MLYPEKLRDSGNSFKLKIEGAALKLHQRIIAVAQRNRTQAEELCVFVSGEIDFHPF